jgi:hypothetical protein
MNAIAYRWDRQPDAQAAFLSVLNSANKRCRMLQELTDKLMSVAGVRMRDIVDHLDISDPASLAALRAAGWSDQGGNVWKNATGLFPAVVLREPETVWLRVESVNDFLKAHNLSAMIEGRLESA